MSRAHMVKFRSTQWLKLLVLFQVLKEAKVLVWVFMAQNLPQVAYFVYLMYTVS